MADRSPSRVPSSSPIRVLFTVGAAGSMTDGELLARYLGGSEEEAGCAFAVLVDRHGPMVRNVCLGVLGNPDDAADAYQAAFLVLSRRAGAIREAESVGPWLFGVSKRVALRARAAAARRREAERAKAEADAPRLVEPEPGRPDSDDWRALYEELDRLPRRYRDPIVLCHLQGMSQERAAAALGCPAGTLRTRVTRGRALLRARLERRGLSPGSAAPLVLFPAPVALNPALVSIGWASAASRLAVASRGLPIGGLPVPLATETLRSMAMISIVRTFAIGGLIVFGLGIGGAGLASRGPADDGSGPDAKPPAVPVAAIPDEPEPEPEAPARDPKPDDEQERPERGPVVRSEIEGETRVLKLAVPDGASVRKDDLVVELDIDRLKDDLANQQIATEQAQAEYQNAIKSREVAEIEVMTYLKGHFPMEEAEAEGEVELAEAELTLARLRLDELRERFERDGLESKADFLEAEVEVLRAELKVRKAKAALGVLVDYEKERRVKSLEGAVERAKARELANRSRFALEKEKEERTRRMIERGRLYAPADGVVRFPGSIDEGATVERGQILFGIFPAGPDGEADDPEG